MLCAPQPFQTPRQVAIAYREYEPFGLSLQDESESFILQNWHKPGIAYASLMSFGSRLTEARKRKGLTQAQVGEGLGTAGADVGKSVVYGWERKNHYPRADQLAPLCQRLDCSADWLLTGIPNEWPFSRELRQRVFGLDASAQRKLENVMRAHLDMQPMPALAPTSQSDSDAAALDRATQPFGSPDEDAGSTKTA